MRKLILFFLFVFSVTVGFAQSFSGDKLFISVDGGKGVLLSQTCHLLVLIIVGNIMEA